MHMKKIEVYQVGTSYIFSKVRLGELRNVGTERKKERKKPVQPVIQGSWREMTPRQEGASNWMDTQTDRQDACGVRNWKKSKKKTGHRDLAPWTL